MTFRKLFPDKTPFVIDEIDEPEPLISGPVSAPFVMTAGDAAKIRAAMGDYAKPLTRVGPVRSGSLREFEDEEP